MNCKFCQNSVMTDVGKPCPKCGAEGDYIDRNTVTKKDFFKYIAPKNTRQGITVVAVITYIAAFFALLGNIILGLGEAADATGDKAAILFILYLCVGVASAVFYAVMGLLIHTKRSRVAAVILMALSGVDAVYTIINSGGRGRAALFGAGILAVVFTFKFHKQYEQYKNGEDILKAPTPAPAVAETKPAEVGNEEVPPVAETADITDDTETAADTTQAYTETETALATESDKALDSTDISELESVETDNITEDIPSEGE